MKALLPFLVLLLAAATAQGQLYEARAGSVSFEKRSRDAVQVQVEATADWTRDYWQRWLKDNYKIKLKGNGVLKVGKSDYLTASQVLISSTTNQFVDLYSTITAPSDTVAELSVWAATGPDTFLAASGREFGPMRDIVQRFATAARLQAIRDGVNEAEKALAAATKDKEKLERSRANLAGNTKSNLARIEQLHQQNAENKVKSAEDSVKLLDNARLLELRQSQLERNRTRLLNLDRP
ncbi:hypothetical protein [Hymenobacter terrestris]|uniref:DUF4468 domain-containing protein n=1 Tax=Hymenobacter terrestris TaxID=2748310 RepID=A0ABX2PXG8_9BACT|nr:hypothetical protein [Hymenobacter terrestris]NVO83380.1 hypothetical protein [Hymenobacter terrestris]